MTEPAPVPLALALETTDPSASGIYVRETAMLDGVVSDHGVLDTAYKSAADGSSDIYPVDFTKSSIVATEFTIRLYLMYEQVWRCSTVSSMVGTIIGSVLVQMLYKLFMNSVQVINRRFYGFYTT